MRKVHAFVAVASIAALASIASARPNPFGAIDSLAIANYWFGDYGPIQDPPGSNLNTINNNMAGVRWIDQNFPAGPHFTNRHQAALSVGGVPFNFNPGQDFQFDVDVQITGQAPAKAEAGIWFGQAPNFLTPNPSSGALIGNYVLLPDNGPGEVAAFGGNLPFFSNLSTQPQIPLAAHGPIYHMSFNYYATGQVVTYGLNGIHTSALGITKFDGTDGFELNSQLGVYVQGPNIFGNATGVVDVQFFNLSITAPAPGSASLLGLGGLLAARRRRR